MGASLEILSGIIRFGSKHENNPDPYQGTVHLDTDGDLAILKGASGKMTASDITAIAKALIKAGFKRVRWQRARPGGEWKDVEMSLDRWR